MSQFQRAGPNVLSTFKLADTNQDGTVDLREFITTLARANVKIPPEEINFIYEAIDDNNDGTLQYQEIIEVLTGRKQIDAKAFIEKKRARLGINTGISPSEMVKEAKRSREPQIDGAETKTVSTPSGMSSILQKSEYEGKKDVPRLVDAGENMRNFMEIREAFLNTKTGAFSFEDLLQQMDVAEHGQNNKIGLQDFNRVV